MAESAIATLECLCVPGINVVEKLKAVDGYYRVVLGAFDVTAANGKHYHATEKVKQMFSSGGILNRRMAAGLMKGELDHPNVSGLSFAQAVARLMKIDPKNISHHIKKLELVPSKDDKGNPIFLVYGWVKPAGPHATHLRDSLNNREENVAFSVRSLSTPGIYNGKRGSLVDEILTYDNVSEPGIDLATQFRAYDLESISFGREELEAAYKLANINGLENDAESIRMVKDSLGWQKVQTIKLDNTFYI